MVLDSFYFCEVNYFLAKQLRKHKVVSSCAIILAHLPEQTDQSDYLIELATIEQMPEESV